MSRTCLWLLLFSIVGICLIFMYISKKRNRPHQKVIYSIIAALYILLLLQTTIFRFPILGFPHLASSFPLRLRLQYANIIPGYTLIRFIRIILHHQDKMLSAIVNILGNLILFVPFGLLYPLLFPNYSDWKKTLLISFLFTLFIEASQLVFNVGIFDIDDILENVFGSMLGFYLYVISSHQLKNSISS